MVMVLEISIKMELDLETDRHVVMETVLEIQFREITVTGMVKMDTAMETDMENFLFMDFVDV